MHGARVENGASFGLTASTTSGDTHTEGDEGGIHLRSGIIGGYAGYGFPPESATNPGLYVGVAVPVLFPGTQVDVYFQAPPAWTSPLQAGIGFTADLESANGYAMLGRQNERGSGWSLHAGYGVRGAASDLLGRSPALFVGGAVHLPFARHGRAQGYIQTAQGRDPENCFTGSTIGRCTPGRPTRALTAGVAVGWHR
jgi:hypothetical protein